MGGRTSPQRFYPTLDLPALRQARRQRKRPRLEDLLRAIILTLSIVVISRVTRSLVACGLRSAVGTLGVNPLSLRTVETRIRTASRGVVDFKI